MYIIYVYYLFHFCFCLMFIGRKRQNRPNQVLNFKSFLILWLLAPLDCTDYHRIKHPQSLPKMQFLCYDFLHTPVMNYILGFIRFFCLFLQNAKIRSKERRITLGGVTPWRFSRFMDLECVRTLQVYVCLWSVCLWFWNMLRDKKLSGVYLLISSSVGCLSGE